MRKTYPNPTYAIIQPIEKNVQLGSSLSTTSTANSASDSLLLDEMSVPLFPHDDGGISMATSVTKLEGCNAGEHFSR